MSTYYTKEQVDSQAVVLGARIKTRTLASHIVTQINNYADTNFVTDAERSAIALIEPAKFKGSFASLAAIPTVGAGAGDYATLIKAGEDSIAIWDAGSSSWVDTEKSTTSETAASVKTKYESNANTNAFTDAEKAKLSSISDAANITAFTAALDAALA